jgi:predicted CXXCH cytochrome family protein
MKHLTAALALLFAQFLLPLSPAASEPLCLDCHPDKREGKVVHPAIDMGCSSCHVGNHQGEKPAPKLTTTVPDLCFTCHDKTAFDKKVLHAPVAGGMCGSCHNPHASDNPRMLIAAVPDLCFSCHDKNALGKKDAHVKAAAGKCLTCHDPHGSDAAFVLNTLVESHCDSCHDDVTPKHVLARISPNDSHPLNKRPDPLRKGRELSCSSCHNPHATDQLRISTKGLKSPAPLCARCHQKIRVGQ